MTRPLKIALCQFAPQAPDSAPDAPTRNLQRAHCFVEQAAAGGAQIVVFPEYFISGIIADEKFWSLAQPPHHEHKAQPTSHEGAEHWLESFRLLAIQHQIDIVAGTIVERSGKQDENGKEILRNVAHYITKQGEVVGRYEKKNLWWPEKDYLTKGDDEHQVFDTEHGRVGMLICWDLAWPEAFRSLLLQNVEIVIAPTCWLGSDGADVGMAHDPDCEVKFLDSLIVARAFENECVVVFVNCGGKAEDGWIGGSGVTVPFKGWVGKSKSNEEELFFVDLDLDILKDAREVYGIRRDLVPKLKESGRLPEGVEP